MFYMSRKRCVSRAVLVRLARLKKNQNFFTQDQKNMVYYFRTWAYALKQKKLKGNNIMSHKACNVNKRRLYTAVISQTCSSDCFCAIRPAGWLTPQLSYYFGMYCHYLTYSGYTLDELLEFAVNRNHRVFISAVRSLMGGGHV